MPFGHDDHVSFLLERCGDDFSCDFADADFRSPAQTLQFTTETGANEIADFAGDSMHPPLHGEAANALGSQGGVEFFGVRKKVNGKRRDVQDNQLSLILPRERDAIGDPGA
jgi:hypothetical protein